METAGDTRAPPPSWINAEFLQKALRSVEGDSELAILSATVTHANPAGDNYGSDMYRVTGRVQRSCGEIQNRSVIVKCLPQGGLREKLIREADVFAREKLMLTKTLPEMFQLLEQAVPGKYQPFGAKCIYHGDEPTLFLVIEDLKPLGFRMAERRRGLDLSHCVLVMQSLAHFHAASTALIEKDPAALEPYYEVVYNEKLRENFASYTKSAIHSLAAEIEKLPEYNEKYTEKLHNVENTFFDRLIDICKSKEGGWNALVHFDPWVNNMMFKYASGTVGDLRFVDYQTSSYSSPALDIQYFLHTSPREEVRIHRTSDLLRTYHASLQEALTDLGCSQHLVPLEALHRELEERAMFGFYAATTVLPIVLADPTHASEIEQALENNDESAITKNIIYSNEAYLEAIKRLLPVFASKGLI